MIAAVKRLFTRRDYESEKITAVYQARKMAISDMALIVNDLNASRYNMENKIDTLNDALKKANLDIATLRDANSSLSPAPLADSVLSHES